MLHESYALHTQTTTEQTPLSSSRAVTCVSPKSLLATVKSRPSSDTSPS